jgi:hypothetical protein
VFAMQQNQKNTLPGGSLVFLLLLLNAIVLEQGLVTDSDWYLMLLLTVPLLVASVINFKQRQP